MDDVLEALWPLSTTFEYAAELGFAVRGLRPDWWRQWQSDEPIDPAMPLQLHGFSFIRWAEASIDHEVLLSVLTIACAQAPTRIQTELVAALDCVDRDYTPRPELLEAAALDGEAVRLWAPAPSAGYPRGQTDHLDQWTREALDGADIQWRSAHAAEHSDLLWTHSPAYIRGLIALAQVGGGQLTPETWVESNAMQAILASCGALIDAVRCAYERDEDRVPLCLVRPGSHHAERARSSGTCLVNNLAVAAVWALRHGARRVAIFDLDAHHGNGTEDCFWESDKVLTVSVHQQGPFFPGTGESDARGAGAGRGFNVNLPVAPSSGASDWTRAALDGVERVRRFRPDIVLVEFSTDAHRSDPVSDLSADDESFETVVRALEEIGCPVVYELGASLSSRAWIGGIRSLVRAAAGAPRRQR
jgi:acetoin utilization deacetylase AcuC-like enzyme